MILEFQGWCRLNPETRLQYFGDDELYPQIITVAEYMKLSKDQQQYYVLEDAIAAMRDSEDFEFTEYNITSDEVGGDCPYCGGDCKRNDISGNDNFCDGYAGDIDGLSEGQ